MIWWQGYRAAVQRAAVGQSVLRAACCAVAGQRDTRGECWGWTQNNIYIYNHIQIFQFLWATLYKGRCPGDGQQGSADMGIPITTDTRSQLTSVQQGCTLLDGPNHSKIRPRPLHRAA